ncbi:MAG: M23 family metallopeptidase [Polyangiaceae bacterium]
MRHLAFVAVLASTLALPFAAEAADAGVDAGPFTYDPPGTLVPATSGKGRADSKVYVPTMLFPIAQPAAFANSQVYGRGGGSGPGGSQCDKENFSYPWHDNYCESRSWDMPLCPSGQGHQGQDIRGPSCVKNVHNVIAVEDGTITNVGTYSVYLTTKDGTRFDYLHMGSVAVKVGDVVKRGALVGKVSNEFGGTPTTVHLHFNIRQNVPSLGNVYVPPYTSLVEGA